MYYFFTIIAWGFVVLLFAVFFFFKLFPVPEKRNWLSDKWTKKMDKTYMIGRGIVVGWLFLTLLFMTIEACALLVANYKILSPDHQRMAELVFIAAFVSFSVLVPGYIYMELIRKIFRKEDKVGDKSRSQE